MDLRSPTDLESLHLAGIGGSAMNGLALILAKRGFAVRGTDPGIAADTRRLLEDAGIEVFREQDGSRIAPATGLVIATAALDHDNGDLAEARRRGLPVLTYAQALGAIMAEHRGIAVAGTHGKTTTSSLLICALRAAGADPGFIIGSSVAQFGGSFGGGSSDWFVAEACEYRRSFLNLAPRLAVVTGIEADHLDYYEDLDDIVGAFSEFIRGIPGGGAVVYSAACEASARAMAGIECRKVSCGVDEPADYQARGIRTEASSTRFEAVLPSGDTVPIETRLFGRHNVHNALMAFAAAHALGMDPALIARGIGELKGISRRFEHIGTKNDIDIFDDYAHHPTEVRAMIEGARSIFGDRRLVIAFQPHQISRTNKLFCDFAEAFAGTDLVLVSDVYAARDKGVEDGAPLGERLAEAIRGRGVAADHTGDLKSTAKRASKELRRGDLLVTVGAGTITSVAPMVLDLI